MEKALTDVIESSDSQEFKKILEHLQNNQEDRESMRKRITAAVRRQFEEKLEIDTIVKVAEGESKAKTEVAQKLIADGFDHDKIAQLTGLSLSDIKAISLNAS